MEAYFKGVEKSAPFFRGTGICKTKKGDSLYKLKNRIGFAFAFSFFCAKILREISILYPKDKKWNIFKVLHKKEQNNRER